MIKYNLSYKKTKVVNIKNEEYDIYIGRGTKWGNNFREGANGTRQEVIEKYKTEKLNQPGFIEMAKKELRGKILGCHCKPLPCHGDVLVKLIEGE